MTITTVPRLRHDALVRPFDDRRAQPRYIIAIDGCHFVVTPTVAAILEETRHLRVGDDNMDTLAARVAARVGQPITAAELEHLLHHRVPKALIEGSTRADFAPTPIVLRRILLTGASLRTVLRLAGCLFAPATAVAVCGLLIILNGSAAAQIWTQDAFSAAPVDLILGMALTLAGVLAHELGHLAACSRFGGTHGGIGVGIYWCMPAFYAEVQGAWLLPRRQRAAVDAAGVYFQALFVAALCAAQLTWDSPAFAFAIAWSHFLMLHTLNPVLKFDGYWLLCDLAGVYNLHGDIGGIARRWLAGRWPSRMEFSLLAVFALIAAGYFWYVLALLGMNLGATAAGLGAALAQPGLPPAALRSMAGNGLMLTLLCAMALGIARLLARAACAIAYPQQGESR